MTRSGQTVFGETAKGGKKAPQVFMFQTLIVLCVANGITSASQIQQSEMCQATHYPSASLAERVSTAKQSCKNNDAKAKQLDM